MANVITCFRILVSFALLFFPVHSEPFNLLYLTAGISDMVDGMVARRTKNATEFGARLDTAADFAFVVVCLIRLLPVIVIPTWLYVWTGVIALIKGINIVSGFVITEKVRGSTHSYEQGYGSVAVCSAADYPAYRTKPWCDCCLRYSDVRRDS